LVVPITDWKNSFALDLWHICLEPTVENGLTKTSATDALQTRSLDTQRFIRKMGTLSPVDLRELTRAIAVIIELDEFFK
jgi:mRNA interferase MazF